MHLKKGIFLYIDGLQVEKETDKETDEERDEERDEETDKKSMLENEEIDTTGVSEIESEGSAAQRRNQKRTRLKNTNTKQNA